MESRVGWMPSKSKGAGKLPRVPILILVCQKGSHLVRAYGENQIYTGIMRRALDSRKPSRWGMSKHHMRRENRCLRFFKTAFWVCTAGDFAHKFVDMKEISTVFSFFGVRSEETMITEKFDWKKDLIRKMGPVQETSFAKVRLKLHWERRDNRHLWGDSYHQIIGQTYRCTQGHRSVMVSSSVCNLRPRAKWASVHSSATYPRHTGARIKA